MDVSILHDAISLLPEEMLIPVDAMRQKKRIPWKPIATLAACFCLIFGLWLWRPLDKATDSAGVMDGIAECQPNKGAGYLKDEITTEFSFTHSPITAKVISVEEDYLFVTLIPSGESATVYTEKLQEIPSVETGDTLFLTFPEDPKDLKNLYPTHIKVS